jgi:hypothetical protein
MVTTFRLESILFPPGKSEGFEIIIIIIIIINCSWVVTR